MSVVVAVNNETERGVRRLEFFVRTQLTTTLPHPTSGLTFRLHSPRNCTSPTGTARHTYWGLFFSRLILGQAQLWLLSWHLPAFANKIKIKVSPVPLPSAPLGTLGPEVLGKVEQDSPGMRSWFQTTGSGPGSALQSFLVRPHPSGIWPGEFCKI